MRLRNIGPRTAPRLLEVGVRSYDDLERLGSVEVYRRLKERWPRATSLNALWSLEGALLDVRWDQLPPGRRAQLLAELDGLPEEG